MLRGARPVRGIVAWQTERELSLALTKESDMSGARER